MRYTIPPQTIQYWHTSMFFNNSKLVFHVKLCFSSTNTIHAYKTALKFGICKHKKRNICTFWHNRRIKTPLKQEQTQIWPLERSKSADALVKNTQITTNYKESNRVTKNLLRKNTVATQSLSKFYHVRSYNKTRYAQIDVSSRYFLAQLLFIESSS